MLKLKWIDKNTLKIDSKNIEYSDSTIELTRKFRASYYLIGAFS